jgi:hypothetical protein
VLAAAAHTQAATGTQTFLAGSERFETTACSDGTVVIEGRRFEIPNAILIGPSIEGPQRDRLAQARRPR